MKRLFTPENLIEAFITIVVLVVSSVVAYGQDTPTPQPPAPVPAAKIVGQDGGNAPERLDAGKKLILKVDGAPSDAQFVWDVLPLGAADVDQDKETLRIWALASPTPYTVRCWVVSGGGVLKLDHTVTIGPAAPVISPPGPTVKTLRDLAGPKADNVSKAYVQLLDGIGKGLLETREEFDIAEEMTLKQHDCVEHGAKAEIAKRLTVPFEQLKVALKLIVDELGAATPVPTPSNAAVTYVYEKDQNTPPAAVLSGLDRLNREKKLRATIFEQDTRDGDGDVPDQYKVALAEAKKTGLPSLIVTAGERVIKVVKDPKTEEDVFGVAP